jgi:hypothetical protein
MDGPPQMVWTFRQVRGKYIWSAAPLCSNYDPGCSEQFSVLVTVKIL